MWVKQNTHRMSGWASSTKYLGISFEIPKQLLLLLVVCFYERYLKIKMGNR